jgi:hypothetical protein
MPANFVRIMPSKTGWTGLPVSVAGREEFPVPRIVAAAGRVELGKNYPLYSLRTPPGCSRAVDLAGQDE